MTIVTLHFMLDEVKEKHCLENNLLYSNEQIIHINAAYTWSLIHLLQEIYTHYPIFSEQQTQNIAQDLYTLVYGINIGDEFYLKSNKKGFFHHGKIMSDYIYYNESLKLYHLRRVKWIEKYVSDRILFPK